MDSYVCGINTFVRGQKVLSFCHTYFSRNVGAPETDRKMFLFFTFNQLLSIRAFGSRGITQILFSILHKNHADGDKRLVTEINNFTSI